MAYAFVVWWYAYGQMAGADGKVMSVMDVGKCGNEKRGSNMVGILRTIRMGTTHLVFATGMVLAGVVPAFALRAGDADAAHRGPAAQTATAQAPTNRAARRAPAADQQAAAQSAEASGLSIRWHGRLGTPTVIRGKDLGQRGVYSGGKGLRTQGGGAIERDATAVLDNVSRLYGLRDAEGEFKAHRTDVDALGFRHVRMSQRFKGLPVVGGDLIVHFNRRGEAYEVNGAYVPEIDVPIAPAITGVEAVQRAAADLASLNLPAGVPAGDPALCVFANEAEPALAYQITLRYVDAKSGPGRWRYHVNALTGAILRRYNDIQQIADPTTNGTPVTVTGSIMSGEGGTVTSVTGWREHTGYTYLYDTNLHWRVYNVATNGYEDISSVASRMTNDWGQSDRAEMSLARNFTLTQRYYRDVHGLNSFDRQGKLAQAFVHVGINYANAYWDGIGFWFGDGDGQYASCMAVLDICGHEYTHAVTEYSAGLNYFNESGALNESFSDIFGACIEFHNQPDGRANYPGRVAGTADWLCSEDCWLIATALRDMRNPSSTVTLYSPYRQPSRYLGSLWYAGAGDNGGVHYNSGVQNFFFYLLSEGGSGNNDGRAYSVTGINFTNAEQIAFRALTVYTTPDTGYIAVREAWLSAARDLNTNWVKSVEQAWDAVGVTTLCLTPDQVVFRGPLGGPFKLVSPPATLENRGAVTIPVSVSHDQAWVDAAVAGGSVPGGALVTPSLAINSAADGLPRGTYVDTMVVSNLVDGNSQTLSIVLQIGLRDYFTELFDVADNDLSYSTLTFTPDGSTAYANSFYRANRDPTNAFPSTTAGTVLPLIDNTETGGYARVDLTDGAKVWLYGVAYTSFFVGKNGYITFGSGDYNFRYGASAHFNQPRISALFDSMYDGTHTWTQLVDRVVVTFKDVKGRIITKRHNFQFELFFDGRIRLTYLGLGSFFGLTGLSQGLGVPADFAESDLSAYGPYEGPPDAPDALVVQPLGGLTAQGCEGGPFAPGHKVYTLSNTGATAVDWTVAQTQAWVNLSALGGTLAAGDTTNVTVTLAAGSLSTGVYTDTVTFSNTASGAIRPRPVRLTALARTGNIAVWDSVAPATDTNLPFGAVVVGLSRTEHVTITNTDATYPLLIRDIALGTTYTGEDFNDGLAQGWIARPASGWKVKSGLYCAQATNRDDYLVSTYAGRTWSNVVLQVAYDLSVPGEGGMLLRASPDYFPGIAGSAYGFQFDYWGNVGVFRQVDGVVAWLFEMTESGGSQFDGWLPDNTGLNVLTATAQGTELKFYINGLLYWQGADTVIASGRIGLSGVPYGPAYVYHFDNVRVWETLPEVFGTEGPNVDTFALANVPVLPATLPAGGSLSFDVVYAPAVVRADAEIMTISSDDADAPEVRVTLSGEGVADVLQVSPAAVLAVSGHPGGPFSPAAPTFALSNAGPATVSWTAASTQTWLGLSPSAGTLLPGATGVVVVGLSGEVNGWTEGVYAATVIVSNLTAGSAQPRELRLTVFTSPQITFAPEALIVTNVLAGHTQQTLTVGNAAGADGALSFQLVRRETGRAVVSAAAAGVGRPAAGRDFTQVQPGARFRPGRLLVRFAEGVAGATRTGLLAQLGGATVEREYTVVPGLCLVNLGAGQTLQEALTAWNHASGVVYAEPDYEVQAQGLPDDTHILQQWGLQNTGQTLGTPDADIDAPEAWEIQTGSRSVVVAVPDTGVDYTHEDLAANMWRNPGEIPGNGIDDDGNGYVDDVCGINAITHSGNPMDDNGHGTHIAGTIGAVGNNGIGVAGVCWNVQIMALKFMNADASGYVSDGALAIEYAIRNHARVLNCSWGTGNQSQTLLDMTEAAAAAEIVWCAPAGNGEKNIDLANQRIFPACFDTPNIISVMASDKDDEREYWSNWGTKYVDLAAPGKNILSCRLGGGYELMTGSSMATPYVAGACALLLAQNSQLSVADLKDTLLRTVDVVPPPADDNETLPRSLKCVSGGRLNVARALAQAGAFWFEVTPAAATNIPPGGATNLTVRFDAGRLAAGTYEGEIVFTSNDPVTPQTNMPCVMVVLNDDFRLSPAEGLAMAGPRGGPFAPDGKVYGITNGGSLAVNWTSTWTKGWATVEPPGGTLASGAAGSVTVRPSNAANMLAAGSYTQTVVFSNLASGAAYLRDVHLTVIASANTNDLGISSPVAPAWIGRLGGPFVPSNIMFRLVNTGLGSLTWSAGSTSAWVSIAAPGGTLAAGEATNLAAWVNSQANTFTQGVYGATLTFTNLSSGLGQSCGLTLTVTPWTPAPFGPVPSQDVTGVITNGDLRWNSAGGTTLMESALDVVICGAGPSNDLADVQAKLSAAGRFHRVSVMDVTRDENFGGFTPSLAQLQAYDAVLVYNGGTALNIIQYANAYNLGTVMSYFVDGGGGVVCMYAEGTSRGMSGRWSDLSYGTMYTYGSPQPTTRASLGTVYDSAHPLMQGVTHFDGGLYSYRPSAPIMAPDITRVADWSDGRPLVITKTIAGRPRADLSFYPASSDVNTNYWDTTTDGARLMANALKYVAEATDGYGCWYDVYFGTSPTPTNRIAQGTKKTQVSPGPLAPYTTYYWQVIASNGVGVAPGPVWSFTTTGFGGGATGNETNTLPFVASFEQYPPGFYLPGTDGWYAANAEAAVVSADPAALAAEADYSAACGLPLVTNHNRLLYVADAVNTALAGPSNIALWCDMLVRFDLSDKPPATTAADQLSLCAGTNGHLILWHRFLPGQTNVWTQLDPTVQTDRWYRVTLRLDYAAVDPVHTASYFQVDLDGVTVSNAAAYSKNDGSGEAGGTWFAAACASPSMGFLGFAGGGFIDDIVVGTNNPHHRLAPLGTPEWWLLQYGLTNAPDVEETSDTDGDGRTGWEEFVAGTDPTNGASVFRFTPAPAELSGARRPLSFDSVAGRHYRLNVSTNLLFGNWTNGLFSVATNGPLLPGPFTATNGTTTIFVEPAAPREFYRGTVER